jgi:hypothetical protein
MQHTKLIQYCRVTLSIELKIYLCNHIFAITSVKTKINEIKMKIKEQQNK